MLLASCCFSIRDIISTSCCSNCFLPLCLLLLVLQEEMNTWISTITAAVSGEKPEVTPSSHSTPAPAARAQTLPATVAATATAESSPGKREKDKEKRFSLFSKKK